APGGSRGVCRGGGVGPGARGARGGQDRGGRRGGRARRERVLRRVGRARDPRAHPRCSEPRGRREGGRDPSGGGAPDARRPGVGGGGGGRQMSGDRMVAGKGGYRHFMLKEIYEQPRAITDTFRGRISPETGDCFLPDLNLTRDELRGFARVVLVACGTSYHAA